MGDVHTGRLAADVSRANDRIRQLEELNKVLAAEVDRCRPVVEAAIKWNKMNYRDMKECELALDAIGNACDDYESSKPK